MPDNKPLPHRIQARVYYEDTDAGGIIYHSRYLGFAERGRTEFLRDRGYNHCRVREECGMILVVRRAEIDYRAPGKLDDLLDISSEVIEMKNSSMTMRQVISCGDRVLVEVKVVIVAVSPNGRAVRIPPQLRQIFEG